MVYITCTTALTPAMAYGGIHYGITAIYHRLESLMWVSTSKAFHYESREEKEHDIAQVGALKVFERPKAPNTTRGLACLL